VSSVLAFGSVNAKTIEVDVNADCKTSSAIGDKVSRKYSNKIDKLDIQAKSNSSNSNQGKVKITEKNGITLSEKEIKSIVKDLGCKVNKIYS
jgi:hypothetical protein